MSQRHFFITASIICALCSGVYIWLQEPTILGTISPTRSGLISDVANPFGSGDSTVSPLPVANIDDKKGKEMESPIAQINLAWSGRTLKINGRDIYYQFGNGNPMETDKTIKELIALNKNCRSGTSCNLLGAQETVGDISNDDGTWKEFDPIPRITPETERLLYEFLSNPIISQSAKLCGEKFFTYGQAYSVFGSVIGETSPEEWWNPYDININNFLTINPQTGRKELNTQSIHLLRQQLNIPSILVGGTWWTNIPLRDCLEKNNQLSFLLDHVNLYASRLEQEYHSGK